VSLNIIYSKVAKYIRKLLIYSLYLEEENSKNLVKINMSRRNQMKEVFNTILEETENNELEELIKKAAILSDGLINEYEEEKYFAEDQS